MMLLFGPPRFHKLNFDGSKLKCGKVSCGFVIRDEWGEVQLVGAKALGVLVALLPFYKQRLGVLEKEL